MTTIEEVKKNVNIEEKLNKDILFRQSKLLYPEMDDWILNMAIEAYINEIEKGIDNNKEEPKEIEEIN
jgi:hypothetical protein